MNRYLFVILIVLGLTACTKTENSINKFSDPVLVKIADLKDRRSADSLYSYFTHENSHYRKEAALAFGSIRDGEAVEKIGTLLLSDPDPEVRKAAAFSLGQTASPNSSILLEQAASKEKDGKVIIEILEAYGKVTPKWSELSPSSDTSQEKGIAWSMYLAGLNGKMDDPNNKIASALLQKNHSENTRLGAAHFFFRGARNFEGQFAEIAEAAQADPSMNVRMAATLALRKIKTDSSYKTLERIYKSDKDYRVRVNAIRAMRAFPFEQTKDQLLKALNDKNLNVGIEASEVIKATITESFWIELANRVTDIKNWRIQANLYEAILKVKENKSIIDEIKQAYEQSANPYQKAALITAMEQSLGSLDIIEQELFKSDIPVVRTSAAAALVSLNRNKKFQPAQKKRFTDLYIKIIQTGDPALIGTVAEGLGDSTLGYRDVIKDFSFLNEAKKKLSLPKDNEALQPLESAIAYFEKRKKSSEVKNNFNHPIDWTLVKSIPKDQLAIVKTTKGNITLRLLVEDAPGSVANFISLANQNYFDQKFFHRVVPNFVIQSGCSRGDGWGSEDYSIRSEISSRKYKTGSVGMASAGKDTEGTQWFITHSPTPHLDGSYTIFAEVESGMNVVDLIEVGDRILDVEINIGSKK
jgi:cyclophilin family peptidyl-prolyl cis-trans isomerase/HEAT repeat protein